MPGGDFDFHVYTCSCLIEKKINLECAMKLDLGYDLRYFP